jgi:uncharacterized small protein (DUF1192 family)
MMKNNITDIERLQIENEWLRMQLKISQDDNSAFVQLSMAEMEYRIGLLKTITRQQKFLSKLVLINGGHLGINDFIRNAYHVLYQN